MPSLTLVSRPASAVRQPVRTVMSTVTPLECVGSICSQRLENPDQSGVSAGVLSVCLFLASLFFSVRWHQDPPKSPLRHNSASIGASLDIIFRTLARSAPFFFQASVAAAARRSRTSAKSFAYADAAPRYSRVAWRQSGPSRLLIGPRARTSRRQGTRLFARRSSTNKPRRVLAARAPSFPICTARPASGMEPEHVPNNTSTLQRTDSVARDPQAYLIQCSSISSSFSSAAGTSAISGRSAASSLRYSSSDP